MEEPDTQDYKLGYEVRCKKTRLDFGKYGRKRYVIAQPTLFLLRPHTSNMDKHRILRYDLHIFFADACPSNATLCRGHKYTLTYFFSYYNMCSRDLCNFRNLVNLLICEFTDRTRVNHSRVRVNNLKLESLRFCRSKDHPKLNYYSQADTE